jgi:hypothetical protein
MGLLSGAARLEDLLAEYPIQVATGGDRSSCLYKAYK